MIFLYLLKLSLILQKTVILHLEKIPGGITHTGISFKNALVTKRYDFRAFNENNSCLTNHIKDRNLKLLYPNIYEPEFNKILRIILEKFFEKEPYVIKKNIKLGITTKTFREIDIYSRYINNKYIFGIYDCRHYVDRFASWVGVGNIKIWRLSNYLKD
jgi:hypothetical protein